VSTGFSITLDDEGNAVVAGSLFVSNVKKDNKKDGPAVKEDVFIAAFDPGGDRIWLKRARLDTTDYSRFQSYVVTVNKPDLKLSTKLYFDNEAAVSKGVFFTVDSYTVVGKINNTTGFNVNYLSFAEGTIFNIVQFLKEENDILVKNKVEPSVAGLLAAIKLIKSSGMVIPGKDAQEALNRFNPEFKTTSPNIYRNIGNVTFLKNEDGIITIKTHSGKPVLFDKIKVANESKIKITSMPELDEQIDVMEGITVGKAFIWFDLNYIRIFSRTGDLLFDYDSDHTRKTVNMDKDILD
jgi:hypothetical protein